MDTVAWVVSLALLVLAAIGALFRGGRTPMRMLLPRWVVPRELGLGEVIKRLTGLLGISPCEACARRALALDGRVRLAPMSRPDRGSRSSVGRDLAMLSSFSEGANIAKNVASTVESLQLASTIFPPEAPSAQVTGFDTSCLFGILWCRGWTLSPDMGKVYNRRASICGFCGSIAGQSASNTQTKKCQDKNKRKRRPGQGSTYPFIRTPLAAPLVGLVAVVLLVSSGTTVVDYVGPYFRTQIPKVTSGPTMTPTPTWTPTVAPRTVTLVTHENSGTLSQAAFTTVSASCQPGEEMVSGGYHFDANSDTSALVTSSYPSPPGTWSVRALAVSGAPQLTTQVVCMQASFPVTITSASALVTSPDIAASQPVMLSATATCAPGTIQLGGGEELTPDGMGSQFAATTTTDQQVIETELVSAVSIVSWPVSGGWSATMETTTSTGLLAPTGLPPIGGQFVLSAYALCIGQGFQSQLPSMFLTAPAPTPSLSTLALPHSETLSGQVGCNSGQLPVASGFSDATALANPAQAPGSVTQWELTSPLDWALSDTVATTLAYQIQISANCITY